MNRLQISRMARALVRTEGSTKAALHEAARVISQEQSRGRADKADIWRAIRDELLALAPSDAPGAVAERG
ncbi:hypothetical protein AL036_06430 [Salipiger aestuarii]|uniref:hypothetical protein n=1 Tax=Salipiger aestuarii TaxID=568098 RepID=UPI00123AA934|nr:hypothetical protein [Salipiger aestuarii]KAA8608731.1 hypothetical protein AL036_06430 [Salipiger aestuarii]